MKVGVVQTRPITGDIPRNVVAHRRFIDLAVSSGAEVVVFPELSITGYEPTLAAGLATEYDDSRFDIFQSISDARQIILGIGAPTRNRDGTSISLLLFQPLKARQLYSKTYLHPDEERFFVCGQPSAGLIGDRADAALAICYELSVPEHAAAASANGASIYIASVAKPVRGIETGLARLSEIARRYGMTVLMSNCVGMCDGWESAGRTSAWNKQGVLLSQLDDSREGVIVIDTETDAVTSRTI